MKLIFDKSTRDEIGDMDEYEGKNKEEILKDLQADLNFSDIPKNLKKADIFLKKYKHKWKENTIKLQPGQIILDEKGNEIQIEAGDCLVEVD